jgi:hypothetical protein
MVKSKMMHHSRDVNTIVNILASSKKSPPQFEESKKVQKEVINLLKNIVLKNEN